MANVLINKERGLSEAVKLTPGTVWRTWRVAERIRETDDIMTFVIERADERDVKPSLPGQSMTLKALMPDGVHQPRQYSLTKADDEQHRQFSVKRVHGLPAAWCLCRLKTAANRQSPRRPPRGRSVSRYG